MAKAAKKKAKMAVVAGGRSKVAKRGKVLELYSGTTNAGSVPGTVEIYANPCSAFGKLTKLRKDTQENRTLLRTQEAVAKAIQEGVAAIDECRFEAPGLVASFEADLAVLVPTIRLRIDVHGAIAVSQGKDAQAFVRLDEEEARALASFLRYNLDSLS